MSKPLEPGSVWSEFELPKFPTLERDLEVDVVVVGAGITGITAAYLLRESGKRVALIERGRVAGADTCRTTAHLTYVTDERLHRLVDKFGLDGARVFWEAGAAAIDQMWQLAEDTDADCEFSWVPGYLHAPLEDSSDTDKESLNRDAELAQQFGCDAKLIDSGPHAHKPAVRFAHQARFHPRKYLEALLNAIPGAGSHVFENTSFEEVDDKSLTVRANGRKIRTEKLILATHNPLMGETGALTAALFQTKLALYTSYVLGAKLPSGMLPEALFWDTNDPYNYLRVDDREDCQYAIFGGEDVKTGQEKDPEEVYGALEARLLAAIPQAIVQHRWMGQVIATADGLPYIGANSPTQFIATGFAGNGLTLGTLGAMMARDWCLGRSNPWADLFRIDRKPFHGGTWQYLKENADYPYYMLRDRLRGADDGSVEDLSPGEGRILKWQKQKVAAFRNEQGKLIVCSPVCTHLKCLVHWNGADKTWDCPCHGSRFRTDGTVLSGPAEEPLERLDAASAKSAGR